MRINLRTHPKVVRISSACHVDTLTTVGALHAVWSLFDTHSVDGVLDGYTLDALDANLNLKGFASAMERVKWLVQLPDHQGLSLPEFDTHNGQSAKRRAENTAGRKASRTSAECPQNVRTKPGTEREREKKNQEPKSIPVGKPEGADSRALALEAVLVLRKLNIRCTGSNPTLLAAMQEGITPTELHDLAKELIEAKDGEIPNLNYLIATARGRRRDAHKSPRASRGDAGAGRGSQPTKTEDAHGKLIAKAQQHAQAARVVQGGDHGRHRLVHSDGMGGNAGDGPVDDVDA